MAKLIRDELRYIAFAEVYQKTIDPKVKRKIISLLECTAECIAKYNFDAVTMAMVARTSGMTAPSVRYYFKDLEELRLASVKYVRVMFQLMALAEMEGLSTSEEILASYIRVCFRWTEEKRLHSLAWFSFLHTCCRSKKHRELNTVAVEAGNSRLASILMLEHSISNETAMAVAKSIQVFITGAMLSSTTENIADRDLFVEAVIAASRALIRTSIAPGN